MLKSFKFTTKVVFSLVILGFFACVFHITPVTAHTIDSHDKIACADRQISISNHRDQHDLDFIAFDFIPVTPLDFNIDFLPIVNQLPIHDSDLPPDKIALYIKNNIILI